MDERAQNSSRPACLLCSGRSIGTQEIDLGVGVDEATGEQAGEIAHDSFAASRMQAAKVVVGVH
jgi:hypothetical protein